MNRSKSMTIEQYEYSEPQARNLPVRYAEGSIASDSTGFYMLLGMESQLHELTMQIRGFLNAEDQYGDELAVSAETIDLANSVLWEVARKVRQDRITWVSPHCSLDAHGRVQLYWGRGVNTLLLILDGRRADSIVAVVSHAGQEPVMVACTQKDAVEYGIWAMVSN
jgi:hypothetical protein